MSLAFALGLMTVAPTKVGSNDFAVNLIPQAEPGFIPEGG